MSTNVSIIAIVSFLAEIARWAVETVDPVHLLVTSLLMPVAWFILVEAIAAIVGHHSVGLWRSGLHLTRKVLIEANDALFEENFRLAVIEEMLTAENRRLREENERLLRRALEAEILAAGIRPVKKRAAGAAKKAGRLPAPAPTPGFARTGRQTRMPPVRH